MKNIEDYSPIQKRILENRDVLQKAIVGFMISSSTLDLMTEKVVYGADHLKLLKIDGELSKVLHTFPKDFIEGLAMCPENTKNFHQVLNKINEANKEIIELVKKINGDNNGN